MRLPGVNCLRRSPVVSDVTRTRSPGGERSRSISIATFVAGVEAPCFFLKSQKQSVATFCSLLCCYLYLIGYYFEQRQPRQRLFVLKPKDCQKNLRPSVG